MSRTISIDEEVFSALQERAEPFVDSPNAVLRRILSLREKATGTVPSDSTKRKKASRKRNRIANGVLLQKDAYYTPILQALFEAGGQGIAKDIVGRVGTLLKSRLGPDDNSTLRSGVPRWVNRTQFARYDLVKDGLLDPSTPPGVWKISEVGRERLAEMNGREANGLD